MSAVFRSVANSKRWVAVLLWAVVIFAVSSVPGSNLPGGYSVPAHFVEYALLGALLLWALRPRPHPLATPFIAALVASVYGVSDELHQAFVPLRTPDPMDWAIDTLGALCGIALVTAISRMYRARKRETQ